MHLVDNAGCCSYQIQIVLPLQSFLNNLQMQKSKEAAPEAKSEGNRGFRLKIQGSIIELQLFQRIPEIRIFGAVRRIHAAVHHGIYFFIAWQRLTARSVIVCNCITDSSILDILDGCHDIAYHACTKFLTGDKLSCSEVACLYYLCCCAGSHHTDIGSFFHAPFANPAEDDNSLVGIIQGIKDQRLQRCIRISCRCRDLMHDRLQYLIDPRSVLGRDQRSIRSIKTDHILNLLLHTFRLCAWQINLVDHRENLQIMIQCQIYISKGLCLDSLRRIHDKNSAIAGCQTPAHLVVKIYMTWRVDQVEDILFSVLCRINGSDGLSLDRDASFPFQLHIVKNLCLHFPAGQQSCFLYNSVCQGGFTVINMCHDTEISDFTLVNMCHKYLLVPSAAPL